MLEDGAFALLVLDAEGGVAHVYLWVGGESELSYERDKEILEAAHDFLSSKGLPKDSEVRRHAALDHSHADRPLLPRASRRVLTLAVCFGDLPLARAPSRCL